MGRHTLYTTELAAAICDRIAAGETLESICRDEGMPSSRQVHEWADENSRPISVPATFASAIALARHRGYDAIADHTLEIADDSRNDWMKRRAAEGDEQALAFNAEHVQRSKLRVDTRLKLLAKWSKKYADRTVHAGDPDAPLVTTPEVDRADLARRVAFMLTGGLDKPDKP